MSETTVYTKEEFKEAIKAKVSKINLEDDALKYYKAVRRLKSLGKFGIALGIGGLALIPLAGPAPSAYTFGLIASAAASESLQAAALIAFISFMGISLIYAIFSQYSEIEANGFGISLKLKK
ncbi:hypothetical protein [Acinetobacter soli]|uniref:hypothetical protein n=1 Tax=Acinetobacter soli TaxID=487316 RepID=UPI00280F4535|nr:hypothetical protein [Acinetobacter soli]MDQ8942222.1 hypothetical protein [Acinetobacter soli]